MVQDLLYVLFYVFSNFFWGFMTFLANKSSIGGL